LEFMERGWGSRLSCVGKREVTGQGFRAICWCIYIS